jgi:hypothetical protein
LFACLFSVFLKVEDIGHPRFKSLSLTTTTTTAKKVFPVATNDPVETLAILAHCDASVFSFGTYGWIGAWLANGPVTYSRHLLNEGGDLKHCDVVTSSGAGIRDHIPPNWIPL